MKMEKPKKNLEASIYGRLKNVARQRKRPVQPRNGSSRWQSDVRF